MIVTLGLISCLARGQMHMGLHERVKNLTASDTGEGVGADTFPSAAHVAIMDETIAFGRTAFNAPSTSSTPTPMTLQLFNSTTLVKHNALCNDGSPSGYYFAPSRANSTKWIVYLEGGGLCYDYETCKKRPEQLISSTAWPKTLGAQGLFGVEPSNNFSDFNKVIIIYCTSDLYTGTKPSSADPALKFNFLGSHVVPAFLFEKSAALQAATEVLFTGGSAGGIGTFMNYEIVKRSLPHAHVRALPDAGWFLTTMKPYSKKAVPVGTQLEKGMALWKGTPPPVCAAAMGSGKAWMCYSGPFVYPFMPSPASDVMVLKAQTDAWTVGNDGVGKPFSVKEMEWLVELAAEVRASLQQVDHVQNDFSANCLYHTSLQLFWDTISINSVTLSTAVQSWYFGNKTVSLVDSCTLPLCNPTCL
jgi:hypothetical protein